MSDLGIISKTWKTKEEVIENILRFTVTGQVMLKLELGRICLDSMKYKFVKRVIKLWSSALSSLWSFQDPNGQSHEKSDVNSELSLL